jgi:hypothetical protein
MSVVDARSPLTRDAIAAPANSLDGRAREGAGLIQVRGREQMLRRSFLLIHSIGHLAERSADDLGRFCGASGRAKQNGIVTRAT